MTDSMVSEITEEDKMRARTWAEKRLPKKYKGVLISDLPEEFSIPPPEGKYGYYLWGPCGTGKTHIACALVVRHVMKHKYSYPDFNSLAELLLSFKMNKENMAEAIADTMNAGNLLIIDDIGTEKLTDWALETLHLIVDARYSRMLPTIYISNLSLGDLSERVGDRITSRIAEMCKVVKIDGKDRRIQ